MQCRLSVGFREKKLAERIDGGLQVSGSTTLLHHALAEDLVLQLVVEQVPARVAVRRIEVLFFNQLRVPFEHLCQAAPSEGRTR